MITPEQHAEIRRLHYGEHWKVGTIAAALGVHHDTVRAAIAHDTQGLRRGTCRATMLDPYLPFIRDTLAQYPRLRATRLFEMVRARGYTGSVVQLRRVVHTLRPAATSTVYRRLTTLMGEDYGETGDMLSAEEVHGKRLGSLAVRSCRTPHNSYSDSSQSSRSLGRRGLFAGPAGDPTRLSASRFIVRSICA
jgi:hypothetical protein